MAKDKDSIILYQKQTDKCRKYMDADQFGRLMMALLDFAKGETPEVDDDIAMAFEFMSLQHEIDARKYAEKCAKNRENGKKGGRPKKEEGKPKKANGFFQNPNDNDNDNEKIIMNDNDAGFSDKTQDHDDNFSHFGTFENVELTETERDVLKQTYERSDELIDKVSLWLRTAKNDVPDHYALCIKFATNDAWPKRKVIPPVEVYEVQDPLSEEEQDEKVAEMRARLNKAIPEA